VCDLLPSHMNAGSDATEWLGAAGLGLPGFSSFIKKEAAEVLQDGGLS
jgi:hypothetical protein